MTFDSLQIAFFPFNLLEPFPIISLLQNECTVFTPHVVLAYILTFSSQHYIARNSLKPLSSVIWGK